MELRIERTDSRPLARGGVEIVERKGRGHPDTICDAIAEEAGNALSRHYVDRFGAILHHNVDKVLLVAGASRPRFGGGEVVEPIEITIAGRAAREVHGEAVPVDEIVIEAARGWLRRHLRHLDVDAHVRVSTRIRPGSSELVENFMRQARTGVWLANDTSVGVGFAPLTRLERTVLELERELSSPELAAQRPEVGEDVKVMGIRTDRRIEITVADALVDRHVRDLNDYTDKRQSLRRHAESAAERLAGMPVRAVLNAADDLAEGAVYITVTGTSAEVGDDGEAGRGNRANGLITPYRPMTLESVAGKNPVSHVGKIYNVTAQRMAADLVARVPGVQWAEVLLVSRIGRPVREPRVAHVRLGTESGAMGGGVDDIVQEHLAATATLWRELIEGRLPIV